MLPFTCTSKRATEKNITVNTHLYILLWSKSLVNSFSCFPAFILLLYTPAQRTYSFIWRYDFYLPIFFSCNHFKFFSLPYMRIYIHICTFLVFFCRFVRVHLIKNQKLPQPSVRVGGDGRRGATAAVAAGKAQRRRANFNVSF